MGKNLTQKNSLRKEKERLTNMYMINLTWGIVGIIAFLVLGRLYRTASVLVHMQLVSWILTGVFALSAIVLFVIGKNNNHIRMKHYGEFLGICALFSLWLALYNKIRFIAQELCKIIFDNPAFSISSYWNTRIPIILICAYLVIYFIVYLVKLNKK